MNYVETYHDADFNVLIVYIRHYRITIILE